MVCTVMVHRDDVHSNVCIVMVFIVMVCIVMIFRDDVHSN